MKILIAGAFIAIFFFSGCCDRIKCFSDAESVITLQNFTDAEMDSIIIKHYLRGSNFTILLDSFSTLPYPHFEMNDTVYNVIRWNGYAYYQSDDSLNLNSDMEIYIPASAQTYRITELNYRPFVCKQCGGKKAYEWRLSNYSVNDSLIANAEIVVPRQ